MTTPIVARVESKLAKDIEYFSKIEKLDKSATIRRLLTKAVKQEKMNLALERYRKDEISIARAAEIANIPLADMLRKAAENKIPLHYNKEDLLRDFKA